MSYASPPHPTVPFGVAHDRSAQAGRARDVTLLDLPVAMPLG